MNPKDNELKDLKRLFDERGERLAEYRQKVEELERRVGVLEAHRCEYGLEDVDSYLDATQSVAWGPLEIKFDALPPWMREGEKS